MSIAGTCMVLIFAPFVFNLYFPFLRRLLQLGLRAKEAAIPRFH
jgi:hypothetical protein